MDRKGVQGKNRRLEEGGHGAGQAEEGRLEIRLHVPRDDRAAAYRLIHPIDDGDSGFDAIGRRLDNRPFGRNLRDADHGFHL